MDFGNSLAKMLEDSTSSTSSARALCQTPCRRRIVGANREEPK
jgi:hypothetical protein